MKGNKRMNTQRTLLSALCSRPSVMVSCALPSRLAGSMHSDPWPWAGNRLNTPTFIPLFLPEPLQDSLEWMFPSSLKLHCHHFCLVKVIVSENNHKFKTSSFQSNILRQLYFQKLLSLESSVLCCECCHGWAPLLFLASVFWPSGLLFLFWLFCLLLQSDSSLAFPYQLSEGRWEGENKKKQEMLQGLLSNESKGTGDEREGLWGLVFYWFH